ncbi:hypothetical protein KC906_02840, partial [Candidatus Kaiserbacteria bacterium]|nr:hypothetical protein [Candidatus Kaiserbacteria bacterium]
MGRVFTWEEVCRRHVPTERSFEMVMSYLQKALADATVAGIVQGAVVCGSVGRGDGDDLRRDLDCFVVYEYERRAEAVAVLQAATAIAKQFFVELAIIPANSQIVSTSLHHFGPAFLEHLEWSVA